MKSLRSILFLTLVAVAFGQQPKNVQKNPSSGVLTEGFLSNRTHTFLSGAAVTFDVGSTLTVNGTFNANPAAGSTWNLANVTVTNFGGGDALTSGTLDQFTNVTQTAGMTLAITGSTTLNGGTHSGTNTGDQNIVLSGAVTGTGTGAITTTLSNTAVTPATYGNATHVPQFTVTADGRLTAATPVAITASGNVTNSAALPSGNIVLGGGAGVVGPSNIAVTGGNNIALGNLSVSSMNVTSVVGQWSPANGGTGVSNSGTITVTSNATVGGTNTGDQNIFQNIVVSGQTTVAANSTTGNLTFVEGSGITITTNNTNKSITINSTAGGGNGTLSAGIGTLWPTASIASPPTGFFAAGDYGTTANTALGAWSIIVASAGTVATPTADVAAGAVVTGTTVTFSSSTPSLTNFRSTTNGTDPTYTVGTAGPTVTVTANNTYEFVANRQGWVTSAVASRAYTIDPLPLLSSAAINGTALTLTYSEIVTRGGAYSNAHFDLDMSTGGSNIGVTYVSGDGTTSHTYTAATAAVNGETVDIDFSGVANSIRETGGYNQSLAAIVSGAVTNNTAGGGSAAFIAGIPVAGGENGGTSGTVDTTGANFAVIAVSYYPGGGAITVSDSKSNTWTALTAYTGGNYGERLYYTQGGTFGTSHTFTISGTGIYAAASVATFSNISASPADVQNGSVKGSGWTTYQGGSITPSQANTVVIVGLGFGDNTAGTISINDSYTIPASGTVAFSANNNGASIAYKILTAATAQNPTWTTSAFSNEAAVAIASFKY